MVNFSLFLKEKEGGSRRGRLNRPKCQFKRKKRRFGKGGEKSAQTQTGSSPTRTESAGQPDCRSVLRRRRGERKVATALSRCPSLLHGICFQSGSPVKKNRRRRRKAGFAGQLMDFDHGGEREWYW
ncbi:hypothetical protein ACLB2K_038562 [Fragaria x ananassa]